MRLYNPSEGVVRQVLSKEGKPFEVIINPFEYSINLSVEDAERINKTYKFLQPTEETVFDEKPTEAKKTPEQSIRNQEIVRFVQKQMSKEYEELFEEIDKKLAQLDDKNYLDALITSNKVAMAIHHELVKLNSKVRIPMHERAIYAVYNLVKTTIVINSPKNWKRRLLRWKFKITKKLGGWENRIKAIS